jgi:hypothetical protein
MEWEKERAKAELRGRRFCLESGGGYLCIQKIPTPDSADPYARLTEEELRDIIDESRPAHRRLAQLAEFEQYDPNAADLWGDK